LTIPHLARRVAKGLALASLALMSACQSSPTESIPTECTPELTLGPLEVGESVQISGAAARLLCPAHAGGGVGEFVLVTHAATGPSPDTANPIRLDLRLRSSGLRAPGAEPGALAAEAPGAVAGAGGLAAEPFGSEPGGPEHDHEAHMGLRELERRELGPLVRSGPGAPPRIPGGFAVPAAVPTVGDLVEYNAQSQSSCSNPIYRHGRVEAVSQKAIVVADTLNPSGGFSSLQYAEIAAAFDTLIAPSTEEAFGTPTDIDGNGRVILFFTQEVNQLAGAGANQFVAGFFFARDLFPADQAGDGLQRCEHSNEAEILYLLVPDPTGQAGSVSHSLEDVKRFTLSTVAHEYQHLINAARRLRIVRSAEPFEAIWLNEGLSHMAEELLFYRASGLAPRSNLTVSALQQAGSRAVTAFNEHQILNASRYRNYISSSSSNSPYHHRDLLATRGAMWSFLRYAVDRRAGSDNQLFRSIIDGNRAGFPNLASALGGEATLHNWLADWAVALYADSRVEGLPARFRDRSWNHPNILAAIAQGGSSPGTFPIEVSTLPANGERNRTVTAGGSAYFRFALQDGTTGSIDLTAGNSSPGSNLRVTLLRIR